MIVIIGLGQSFRGDDEAGLSAVRHWEDAFLSGRVDPRIRVELAESPGIGLLALMDGADTAILVDAVHSDDDPGTIHSLTEADLGAFQAGSSSAHGWGVAETLALGRSTALYSLPEKLIIVGIEIGQVNMGAGLSPAVEDSIPKAAKVIQEFVEKFFDSDKDADG
jgi:hydrogenase maturation protease